MRSNHYQVTHGQPLEVCQAYWADQEKVTAQLGTVASQHGANPAECLRCGNGVEALRWAPGAKPGAGWRAVRDRPRFYRPNPRSKVGHGLAEQLKTIRFPCSQQLAQDLGCPGFFRNLEDGHQYCADMGIFRYLGAFYLQGSAWCLPNLRRDGIRPIPASEWHKANEDSLVRP